MNFEVLKKNHLKRNIIIGVVAVAIISACVLTFTRAKYRTTQSIQIAKGTINYSFADLNIMAMYQENDLGEYENINIMPNKGYIINESESYCTVNGNKDENAKLYTNENGEHVMVNLQEGSKCYLYFDEIESIANIVLTDKDIQTRSNFNSTVSEETTNRIYQTSDGDGTTYYFAGNPTDNWVQFAGYYWRIIRINGDGTLRMIYAGTDPNVTTGTGTKISLDGNTTSYAFNTNRGRSEYVGLKYTQGQQYGTATNSNILDTLNTWYNNNLVSYESYIDQNAGFCGDRNIANGYIWSSQPSSLIYYVGHERLAGTRTPNLECNRDDLFTVMGANKGNASLTNPIGLITADEVSYAGGLWSTGNNGYYLYTGQAYWTMSPSYFDGSDAGVLAVNTNGDLHHKDTNVIIGVRPVINLASNISFNGTGTSTDPYKIVGLS